MLNDPSGGWSSAARRGELVGMKQEVRKDGDGWPIAHFGEGRAEVVVYEWQRKGGNTFSLRYRHPDTGRRIDKPGGILNKIDAFRLADDFNARLLRGLSLPETVDVPQTARAAGTSRAMATGDALILLESLARRFIAGHDRESTRKDYLTKLNNYLLPEMPVDPANPSLGTVCLARIPVAEWTPEVISLWLIALSNRKCKTKPTNLSDSTRDSALTLVVAIVNFALLNDIVDSPRLRAITRMSISVSGKRKPQWFKDEGEFFSILPFVSKWAKVPMCFAVFTGARFGEFADFLIDAVDFELNRIWVKQEIIDGTLRTVKTPESENWIPLHPTLRKVLEIHIEEHPHGHAQRARLFLSPRAQGRLHNSALRTQLHKGLAGAGITRNITIHGLRHSNGSWLSRRGATLAEIKRALRHADSRTTEQYIHTNDEDLIDAVGRLQADDMVQYL